MDLLLAFCYAGTAWFAQLCMLFEYRFIVGKKSEYLLFMTIPGEQREDAEVKELVRRFKKEFWAWMAGLFAAIGGFFLILLLPAGVESSQLMYLIVWCTVLIVADYKVIKKYANRMYELKIKKGWGNPPKQSGMEIDTVVSRMKKTMPVSEIWLMVPLWICIGSFLWWFQYATEYKILLVSLVFNVGAFLFFCYMYQRMAHGKLKVYSEDSEINYALNRASKRAWTGCVVWEAVLLCGSQFIITVLLYSYMNDTAAGVENVAGFWGMFIGSMVVVLLAVLFVFFRAAGRVKQAKKELAAAANLSFAEDEDVYWRNGYYYNPNDTNSFVESRTLGITTNMATKWGPATKWILLITLMACIGLAAALLPFDFGRITMEVKAEGIELRGCIYYKENVSFEDISEVLLLPECPEASRVWGTGTERFALGDYRFKDYGNGRAMLDKDADYFILVKRQNGKWIGFSTKDSEEMLKAYELLNSYVNEGKAQQDGK